MKSYPKYYYRYGVREQTLVKRLSPTRFDVIMVLPEGFRHQGKETMVPANLDLWLRGCPFVPGLPDLYEAIVALLEAEDGVLQAHPKRKAS